MLLIEGCGCLVFGAFVSVLDGFGLVSLVLRVASIVLLVSLRED